MPIKHISMPKKAPARGEPNTAPKADEMPASMRSWWSCFLRWARLEMLLAMVPPICTAAPSRPADPPVRCVSVEQTKVRTAMRIWMRRVPRAESMTRLLPRLAARPWFL